MSRPHLTFSREGVRDPRDRRCVVYWRWACNGIRLGAVCPESEGFRALVYRRNADGDVITELGMHETRRAAEQAVRDWAGQNPTRIAEGSTR